MFFNASRKRYPHLAQFVEHRVAQAPQVQPTSVLGWMFGAALLVLGLIMLVRISIPAALVPLTIGGMLCFWGYHIGKAERRPEDRLALEAHKTVVKLSENLKKGRSQIGGQEASYLLLDETARQWSRVQNALTSPFWSSPNLPSHYVNVREQARWAADRGMDEILVLFSPQLSETSGRTGGVNEFVEDLIETYVLKTPPTAGPLPIGYDIARDIAEKLKGLANEVEVLTKEVAKDSTIRSEFTAESALDVTIAELKSINQAETELRQNLNG